MKKKKAIKLEKVRIANLTNEQLINVQGGDGPIHILGTKPKTKHSNCVVDS